MCINRELELALDEEKSSGFLSFKITKDTTCSFYRLYVRLTKNEDKKKYRKWKCDVVAHIVRSSCNACGRRSANSYRQGVASSILPDRNLLLSSAAKCCSRDQSSPKFTLFVFLHNETVSEPRYYDRKAQFTDEAQAKELNANCKIHFEDSVDPVFVNRHFLAMYSNVFRVMFEGDFKEKNAEEVKLEVEREDFLSFLDCLYLPPAPVTETNFKAVAMIADRYDCSHLLEKCEEFAAEEAEVLCTVEEGKDYVEVADRFQWDIVTDSVIDSMKTTGVLLSFFLELLDSDWMMARNWSTRLTLFSELRKIIPSASSKSFVKPKTFETTVRFTDEVEAKELDANCVIHFEDSDKPAHINRELLSVYSKVFRTMFHEDFKEAEELKLEVKRSHFLSFLDCLYYPTVPVCMKNFKAVALVAKQYDCPKLFNNCEEFIKKEAKSASTFGECKDFIEVAEFFEWEEVLTDAVSAMKNQGVDIFISCLKERWIENRKKNTQQVLFAGLKEVVLTYAK